MDSLYRTMLYDGQNGYRWIASNRTCSQWTCLIELLHAKAEKYWNWCFGYPCRVEV